ncbi:MAG: hypothetical protein IJY09_07685 [Lachnospiraceae bacterium]|nr:hypothetical protein [Lachnospiraceae bacterium]
MEFVSILERKVPPNMNGGMPDFFVDFNLDQIIAQIQYQSVVPVEKYFSCLPMDREGEEYRRQIYVDVKKPEIYKCLVHFAAAVQERKQLAAKKNEVEHELQKAVWHVLELALYCDAYRGLYKELQQMPIASEGLLALRELLKSYTGSEDFLAMHKRAVVLREQLQSFRVKLLYEHDHIVVIEENVSGAYEEFLHQTLGEHMQQMKSPFSQSLHLSNLELEIIQKFIKKQPEFFKAAKELYQEHREYEHEVLLRFGDEISYYLSYYAFQQSMELRGFSFVTPTAEEHRDMCAQGLYDLALACASLKTNKEVISNDMYYGKDEQFFVLTGPNQGGKTTFARSLGQLIYFSKMGLDVPATAANVHYFTGILSHFSVEESVETGRGKLMEELLRLKPMMHEECKHAFVVINELFTTAANYDACIMGKKVLEHFIGQECRGIYVTHLKELTKAHETVVSMRAMLDEKKVQSFQIRRGEADDSACAMNQVNKYRLGYEQLKERLK